MGRPQEGHAGHRLAGPPVRPKHGPAAHPNSRFTVTAKQQSRSTPRAPKIRAACPSRASCLAAGGAKLAPLVYEARNWQHGVLVGASVASETTAAATGEVGVVRRDPMAMQPFCGYNFGDYWRHWLKSARSLTHRAEDLSRELVPPRCAGQLPLARVRRQSAGARLDARARARPVPVPRIRRSAPCRDRRISTWTGSDISAESLRRC